MSGSGNSLARQALAQDFIAAPTKTAVDSGANGDVILAASAPAGRYAIDAVDGDVYVRQVKTGTAVTAATSRRVAQGRLDYLEKLDSNWEVRGITASGTTNVEVALQHTPQPLE